MLNKKFFNDLKRLSIHNDERYTLLISGIKEVLAHKKPSFWTKKTKTKPKW